MTWTTEKFFNTEGPGKEDLNYMVDPLRRIDYDEVSALIGDTLVSVLRQLREGYTKRPQAFPLSVILCGVGMCAITASTPPKGTSSRAEAAFVRWRVQTKTSGAPAHSKHSEQRFVLELKTIREKTRDPGRVLSESLEQTARYAGQSDAEEAHLIICDERAGKSRDEKVYDRIESCGGREIHVWGVWPPGALLPRDRTFRMEDFL
jgi:hypothetical protein